MKKYLIPFIFIVLLSMTACADHDDPKLSPIDTAQIKISATVKDAPDSRWMASAEEMTITVSDVKMDAPKGVVLRSIMLVANTGTWGCVMDEKPFSDEPMVFKIPLRGLAGRVNFSLRGNIIKKDSRDAEVMIADNIQKIVFSEQPEFECKGCLFVIVKSTSTTGEEYNHSFEARSTETDRFTIPVSQNELYWQPASGTASTLEISLGGSAIAWSPNTTFNCAISNTAIGHSSGDAPTLKTTIPNTPGALNALKLQMYVRTVYFGTWETVTIDPYSITNVFDIVETD